MPVATGGSELHPPKAFNEETLAAGARGEVDLNQLARDLFVREAGPSSDALLAPWLNRVTRGD